MFAILLLLLLLLLFYAQGTSFPRDLEISKVQCLCPEWLPWGLGNCQRIGQSHCVKTLNCHGDSLVQKRSFPWIGCAARCPPANLCQEMLSLVRFKLTSNTSYPQYQPCSRWQ